MAAAASVAAPGPNAAAVVVVATNPKAGAALCAIKEMTCRWIRQGCIISLVRRTRRQEQRSAGQRRAKDGGWRAVCGGCCVCAVCALCVPVCMTVCVLCVPARVPCAVCACACRTAVVRFHFAATAGSSRWTIAATRSANGKPRRDGLPVPNTC